MKPIKKPKTRITGLSAVLLLIFAGLVCTSCSSEELRIKPEVEKNSPQVLLGMNKLKGTGVAGFVKIVDNRPDLIIQTSVDSINFKPEAFQISVENKKITVTGGDATGLMYGLFDIKEQLESGQKTIVAKMESPHLPFRAIKFNLPWMSYRTGEALQLHSETVRDTSFWRAFLDMMAENRFNALTLWSQHPFHYMVKTEKYPEACGFSDEEMAGWKKFWNYIFREAKNRGIETYIVNWNIFVSPEFAKAHSVAEYSINNEYFINLGDTSEIVKDYMRESVKAVIDTYPDLTGLGISHGEGMGGMTPEERQIWMLESIIQGARNASRKIKFIHRIPFSANLGSGGSTSVDVERMTRRSLDTLSCFIGPVMTELKFNWSHAHSTPSLVKVHGGELTDTYWNPLPRNYKLAWMMRNEDFFILRWGQPEFIRKHIAQNVQPYVNGYYVGSECYIPAKDFITALEGTSNKYAFERQWMFYKNWGRLLYNPKTPDSVFEQAFVNLFPEHGKELFEAQKKVSRVPLIVASYWNATWDFTLYSEGMLAMENNKVKLISLAEMAAKEPMEPAYLSIQEFLDNGENSVDGKITPLQLADSVETFCLKALADVEKIEPGKNTDLLYEVSDIRAWSQLGLYFSGKLRAAVNYQKYLNTGEKEFHQKAVQNLEKAAENWRELVVITEKVYQPMPLMHYTHNGGNRYFHWSEVEKEVIDELEWLKNLD
ncbi:MAG: glycoside hydrolase family 20 zincin-like fold domain-containing protein [Mariniphaga sp.]|nr:glycoside hydrolase family 20 zincin-like fold domain-containing protein [Mariniphaga sp.]